MVSWYGLVGKMKEIERKERFAEDMARSHGYDSPQYRAARKRVEIVQEEYVQLEETWDGFIPPGARIQ